jgi:hypothetical protein
MKGSVSEFPLLASDKSIPNTWTLWFFVRAVVAADLLQLGGLWLT